MTKINAYVRDTAMLNLVQSDNLIAYLQRTGWVDSTSPLADGRWLNMHKDHPDKDLCDIDVPISNNHSDYARRIFELIDTLAYVENRTSLEVYCDLVGLESVGLIIKYIFSSLEDKVKEHANVL